MSRTATLLRLLWCPRLAGGTNELVQYEHVFSETIVGRDLPALAFWRGRVALWTILRVVGMAERKEVVLPAYTCEMVPLAVKFAGATCVYVDAGEGHFNASLEDVKRAITDKTRGVICQHTYGIAQPVRRFDLLLRGKGIKLIEDCCQLISNGASTEGVATTGAASFFSTQWNKPFSTGLGGMAVFRDGALYSRARDVRATFQNSHEQRRGRLLALQMLLYRLTVRPSTRAWVGRIYRSAQRLGWNHGTSSAEEYGDAMPSNYLAGATGVQARIGLEQLPHWPDNVRHRRNLTEFYLVHLTSMGVDTSPLKAGCAEPALWAVPLLVENKNEILHLAAKRALPIATWFDRIPVHIDPATAAHYDYRPGQCPRSEQIFSREIHLPTAPWVSLALAERTVRFLKRSAYFVRT